MRTRLSEECIDRLVEYEKYYLGEFLIDRTDNKLANKLVQDALAILINNGLVSKKDVQRELLIKHSLFLPMNLIEEFCKNR